MDEKHRSRTLCKIKFIQLLVMNVYFFLSDSHSREELTCIEYCNGDRKLNLRDSKNKVRGVPPSFGYTKRPTNGDGGKGETRTAQVSAVPRTKVYYFTLNSTMLFKMFEVSAVFVRINYDQQVTNMNTLLHQLFFEWKILRSSSP